jgi:sulfur-oxidizing protein SoxY
MNRAGKAGQGFPYSFKEDVMLTKRGFLEVVVLGVLAPAGARAQIRTGDDEESWRGLKRDFFGDREIVEDNGIIDLVAPTRAEDAAIVPIDLHFPARSVEADRIRKVTLIVDENPVPLVTTLTRGKIDGAAFDFSTRIRVNSYSYVRVVAETNGGTLHMVKSFVKAAGGCSAPAGKDPEEAKANMGKMRFRSFASTGRDEAQLQIRHPNYSGMQMDQVTRQYTPAWFVQTVSVKQGDELLFSMENGISLSEDPAFRFTYHANGAPVTVVARDSNGAEFRRSFNGEGGID